MSRRQVLRAATYLAAGAVLALGVAVMASMRAERTLGNFDGRWTIRPEPWDASRRAAWLRYRLAGWPETPRLVQGLTAGGVSVTMMEGSVASPGGDVFLTILDAGWPMRATRVAVRAERGGVAGAPTAVRTVGLAAGGLTLPLRIHPWGLAVNVALFAAAIAVGVRVALAGRRWRRRRAGRCPECRHDLRGDLAAGCGECGWSRSSATAAR